jgi:hypothetical protein
MVKDVALLIGCEVFAIERIRRAPRDQRNLEQRPICDRIVAITRLFRLTVCSLMWKLDRFFSADSNFHE